MFIMDVPYIPVQEAPIVLAQSETITPQFDYILKVCKQTESTGNSRSADHAIDPAGMLAVYIGNRDGRDIYDDQAAMATFKTSMLQGTTVGKITPVIDNTGRAWYRYDAPTAYEGKVQATFMTEYQGKHYKIEVNLVVSPTVGESPLMEGEEPVCPLPKLIKVNKPKSGSASSLRVVVKQFRGQAL